MSQVARQWCNDRSFLNLCQDMPQALIQWGSGGGGQLPVDFGVGTSLRSREMPRHGQQRGKRRRLDAAAARLAVVLVKRRPLIGMGVVCDVGCDGHVQGGILIELIGTPSAAFSSVRSSPRASWILFGTIAIRNTVKWADGPQGGQRISSCRGGCNQCPLNDRRHQNVAMRLGAPTAHQAHQIPTDLQIEDP